MRVPAAIGLRAHSGWAAAIAIAGPVEAPIVITRRRIEMADRHAPGPVQPYHAAAGLDIGEAQALVESCGARAASIAAIALGRMIEDVGSLGHQVTGCGLLLASGRSLPGLKDILKAHALIHTAEGELFREALRAASRECGLKLTAIKERELFANASALLQMDARQIEQRVDAMGKGIGPPWQQDQKFAAVAAWVALGSG